MLIPENRWAAIRRRSHLPAFAAVVQRLQDLVSEFEGRPVAVPEKPGGYYHGYFCPEHGVQLVFDPTATAKHRCPVDGLQYHGERYDAGWRWFANERLSHAALSSALLWRLEEKERTHLFRATEILMDYAARYGLYRTDLQERPNPGIATYTTLDESVWLLPLARAFDLVREALPDGKAREIAGRLLAPAAEHLVRHHYRGIHNFACWQNAAIGTVGFVLGREDLVDLSIHAEYGFEAQVREGVLADGLWYEGSFSYHFYALAALAAQAQAACHVPGLDLHEHPALRAMLRAPIACAYPDGSLPATNDCWYFTSLVGDCCHGVPPAAAFYELGWAWYGDRRFAQVLHLAYEHRPRDSLEALLFGRRTIPQVEPAPQPSTHLSHSGYVILRPSATACSEGQQHLLLKYGPHGGRHGHPDKLSLSLFAHGRRWSPDLGTPGYGFELCKTWYRQTISHNTVTIDGLSQTAAQGQACAFRGEGEFQVADATVAWEEGPYARVTMRRAILARRARMARSGYFLDLFLVQAGRRRRMDWIYRSRGACDSDLVLAASGTLDAEGEGYQHVTEARRAVVAGDFAVNWRLGEAGLILFAAGAPGSEIILGSAPGNPATERQSLLINRRHAAATAYLSVFHFYHGQPCVTSVHWIGRDLLGAGWAGCIIQTCDARELWLIRLSPDAEPVFETALEGVTARFEYTLDWPTGSSTPCLLEEV